jgi:hypothetical protein
MMNEIEPYDELDFDFQATQHQTVEAKGTSHNQDVPTRRNYQADWLPLLIFA